MLKQRLLLLLSALMLSPMVLAKPFEYKTCATCGYRNPVHKHNEASYQKAWCKEHNGIEEFENEDYTRVDCLTDKHAVEFDFANKWAESIGQALHYQKMTGKKAKVVLILDNEKEQKVYYERVKVLGKKHKFDVEYVTNDIMKLNEEGKCFNPECKCHRKKAK